MSESPLLLRPREGYHAWSPPGLSLCEDKIARGFLAPLPNYPDLPVAPSWCFFPGSLQQKFHTLSRWPLPAATILVTGKVLLCPQGHSPRKGSCVSAFQQNKHSIPSYSHLGSCLISPKPLVFPCKLRRTTEAHVLNLEFQGNRNKNSQKREWNYKRPGRQCLAKCGNPGKESRKQGSIGQHAPSICYTPGTKWST